MPYKNKAKRSELSMDWHRRHRVKQRLYTRRCTIKRKYGLSLDEYDAMIDASLSCDLCGGEFIGTERGRRPVLDHDHSKVGRESIRGILHEACNAALGVFKDDPDICLRAVKYLENASRSNYFLRSSDKPN